MNPAIPVIFDNSIDLKSKKLFIIGCLTIETVGIILIFIYNDILPLFTTSGIAGVYFVLEWLDWEYFRPQRIEFTDQEIIMYFKWKSTQLVPYDHIEAIKIAQLGNDAAVPAKIKPIGKGLIKMTYVEIGHEALKRYENAMGVPAPSWDYKNNKAVPR